MSGYHYAKQDKTIFVNLYAAGTADVALDGGMKVKITQATNYPWDGHVSMTVDPAAAGAFALNVRIPGWAMAQAVPSDLYAFTSAKGAVDVKIPELRVNGTVIPTKTVNGYVRVNRKWKSGDVVSLDLPMPVQRVAANDKVMADQNRVAFQRGPIVYAFEWPDNPGANLRNLFVADSAPVTTQFQPALLGGVQVIKTRGTSLATNAAGQIERKETMLTAIPYYAWANRGKGEMSVWVPRSENAATPKPFPTLAMSSRVTLSSKSHLPEQMVNDGEEPTRSNRGGGSSFDWWPTFGTTEWLQYDFPKLSAVSETQVFWFDDTGGGGVKVPAAWRLLYKDGDQWKPVDGASAYTVEKDKWNVVSFKSVTTTAVRLEVSAQPGVSSGVIEWKIR